LASIAPWNRGNVVRPARYVSSAAAISGSATSDVRDHGADGTASEQHRFREERLLQ
jgi:hypothetical protein